MSKPFSESCAQNQQVILDVLKTVFTEPGEVLENGSGTGQHAVYFSEYMPHLSWQTSDLEQEHMGMKMWLSEVDHERIKSPLVLDVDMENWLVDPVEYIFTANTTHIISTPQAEKMFQHVGKCLKAGGVFAQYGPFNYAGNYTSESNARFDQWLKNRNPQSCIKDFEMLVNVAQDNNLTIINDIEMPANNRILIWKKA